MFNTTTIPTLEKVLAFSQARHSVLAGNIANLDTPGYRMRDLSPEAFEARLREALSERDRGGVGGASPGASAGQANFVDELLYHDDSTGSLETQVAAIAKNQMQHNLALSIMSSQFRLLQTAISERA